MYIYIYTYNLCVFAKKKTYQKAKKQTHIWKIQVLSVLPQLVCGAHLSHLQLAILHAAAGAAQMHVEVHAVDAGAGVVLDAQVNVLLKAQGTNERTNKHQGIKND